MHLTRSYTVSKPIKTDIVIEFNFDIQVHMLMRKHIIDLPNGHN